MQWLAHVLSSLLLTVVQELQCAYCVVAQLRVQEKSFENDSRWQVDWLLEVLLMDRAPERARQDILRPKKERVEKYLYVQVHN